MRFVLNCSHKPEYKTLIDRRISCYDKVDQNLMLQSNNTHCLIIFYIAGYFLYFFATRILNLFSLVIESKF
jgi:hypothetical protein